MVKLDTVRQGTAEMPLMSSAEMHTRMSRAAKIASVEATPAAEFAVLGSPSFAVLVGRWRILGLRGCAAVLFGIALVLWPNPTPAEIIRLFADYVILDGVVTFILAVISARHQEHWIVLGGEILLNFLAAAAVLFVPIIAIPVMIFVAACWVILANAAFIVIAPRFGMGSWPMALGAAAAMLLGCLLFMTTQTSARTVALWLGIYALMNGIGQIALAWNLQRTWDSRFLMAARRPTAVRDRHQLGRG